MYPDATDLVQEGADQPLAVYEREFAIGARLAASSTLEPGDIWVPARLRYQACDEKVCYIPATVSTGWTLRIVPERTKTSARESDLFESIRFGTGRRPPVGLPTYVILEPGSDPASAEQTSPPRPREL